MSRRWVLAAIGLLLLPVLTAGSAFGGSYGTERAAPCETTIKPPPPKCANLDCSDPMFTVSHPRRGSYVSGHCAELAIPFAVYDASGTLLFGSADLAALAAITAGSGYQPVATHDGRGILGMLVADYHDTNAGPYREIVVAFPVNEQQVTTSTQNPYAFLTEIFNPKNKVWVHKLLLSEQMPIDYGREILGYDKDPDPQAIEVRNTADDTTFAAAGPLGDTILSGHVSVDKHPQAQAQAVSQAVAAGGEWLEPVLTGGGLLQANAVNPDVLHRSDGLMESHVLVRLKSAPALGLFGPESTLTVNPNSDFGAALSRMDFRPAVSARAPMRLHVDNGFAP